MNGIIFLWQEIGKSKYQSEAKIFVLRVQQDSDTNLTINLIYRQKF